MKLQNIFLVALFALILFSCGKDDGPTATNGAPTISAQAFTASEGISDTQAIGTVKAADPDGDALVFAIVTNSGDLFEIAATTGSLSLKEGKGLDFNTAASHVITVGVSDGEDDAAAQITINVTNVNAAAPVMEDQVVSVDEDVDDATVIYAVVASDADGDELTFTIVENDSDLFEITEAGEISLASGKGLDFETADKHTITVSVTDGVETVEASVDINVENVADTLAEDPASFVTTWKTDADGESIGFGLSAEANLLDNDYDFTVDWGDGTVENIAILREDITIITAIAHEYETAGTYTVAIQGVFPSMHMNNNTVTKEKLLSIEQWGTIKWESFNRAFLGCSNMVHNATDAPDLTQVTNLGFMFSGASSFNGNLSNWNVENITSMLQMFESALSFNGDISEWDTGNTKNMNSMFKNADSFNQNLGGWNITNVINMQDMLSFSGLDTVNYNSTLIGWNEQSDTPSNISLGASGLGYCGPGAAARDSLEQNHNWSISDSGEVPCP